MTNHKVKYGPVKQLWIYDESSNFKYFKVIRILYSLF